MKKFLALALVLLWRCLWQPAARRQTTKRVMELEVRGPLTN